MIRSSLGFVLTLVAAAASIVRGEVKPHNLFCDNTVLQQEMDVPVWGTAADGETVTVEFQNQKVSTTAAGGNWKVVLKPLTAGGDPANMTITGSATKEPLVFKNVVVGEVWVVSGQSNMGMGVGKLREAVELKEKCEDGMLRFYSMPWRATDEPQQDVPVGDGGTGRWAAANPYYTHMFSAVGYYFGRDLRKSRNVPIGLISACVGGSYADCWIPRKYLDADPVLFKMTLERWGYQLKNIAAATERYKKEEPALMKQWEADAAKAKAEGKKEPPKPQPPQDPELDPRNKTAGIYNAMISPIQPYAIRGAAWYQGENDAGDAFRYRRVLPTMITSWRETWGQGDFPFLIVQLPAIGKIDPEKAEQDSAWSELREAQLMTAKKLPNVLMAVSIDCGDEKDTTNLHPPHKAPIGARLAIAARGGVYNEKIEFSGPVYESMKIDGDRVTITFKHTGGGLVAKDGPELKGFAIAGEDQKFVNAKAEIVPSTSSGQASDTVVVSSPQVSKPASVRYAWADYPVFNLWNKADLPATPFRTDDWPITTQPK